MSRTYGKYRHGFNKNIRLMTLIIKLSRFDILSNKLYRLHDTKLSLALITKEPFRLKSKNGRRSSCRITKKWKQSSRDRMLRRLLIDELVSKNNVKKEVTKVVCDQTAEVGRRKKCFVILSYKHSDKNVDCTMKKRQCYIASADRTWKLVFSYFAAALWII